MRNTKDNRAAQRTRRLGLIALSALLGVSTLSADDDGFPGFTLPFFPGNLVVSRSVYDNNPNILQAGTELPPNCTSGCVTATNNGAYPTVWNNDLTDGSFGITSKIFLDQMTPLEIGTGPASFPPTGNI